jgi:hypothetical protein
VALAIDDVNLYVADELGDAVWIAPRGGGAPTSVPAVGPTAIAADGASLFFAETGGKVRRVELGTLDVSDVFPLAADRELTAMAVAGGVLFVAQAGKANNQGGWDADGQIVRLDAASGALLDSLATSETFTTDLVTTSTLVFWTNRADPGSTSSLSRGNASLLTWEAMFAQAGLFRGVATKDDEVYFTDASTGLVLRMSALAEADGTFGAPGTLANGQVGAHGVAVDDQYVYWSVREAGRIMAGDR